MRLRFRLELESNFKRWFSCRPDYLLTQLKSDFCVCVSGRRCEFCSSTTCSSTDRLPSATGRGGAAEGRGRWACVPAARLQRRWSEAGASSAVTFTCFKTSALFKSIIHPVSCCSGSLPPCSVSAGVPAAEQVGAWPLPSSQTGRLLRGGDELRLQLGGIRTKTSHSSSWSDKVSLNSQNLRFSSFIWENRFSKETHD